MHDTNGAAAATHAPPPHSLSDIVAGLGPRFAARAASHDEDDAFAAENYAELKEHGVFAAGVPAELGGGGASFPALCAMLQALAAHCGSTALALAMHTHQVAIAAWQWRHDHAPNDAFLARVAAENLVLLSSGGSDWLQGSGVATRVDGGFRIDARKRFASGAPAADLFMTGAVYDDPAAGPTVLHVAVPMTEAGVRIVPTWRALGMRATGSHDVMLTGVFVADAAVRLRRPQGKWHKLFHLVSMLALPAICAVYLGIAEAARAMVLAQAAQRGATPAAVQRVGGIENEVQAARVALADMIAATDASAPGFATTNRVLIGRTLVARAVRSAVDLALDAAGGAGFARAAGLERLFRDAQASRFHPLPEDAQRDLTGRLALGLAVE
jgi:alkylation response protein AidB-like acyl-CoA dehydrogenase